MVSAAYDIMGAVVEEISVSAVPEDAAVVSSGKLAMEKGKDQLDEGGIPGGEAQPGLRVGVCRKLRGRNPDPRGGGGSKHHCIGAGRERPGHVVERPAPRQGKPEPVGKGEGRARVPKGGSQLLPDNFSQGQVRGAFYGRNWGLCCLGRTARFQRPTESSSRRRERVRKTTAASLPGKLDKLTDMCYGHSYTCAA